jgi:cell division protein FtsW
MASERRPDYTLIAVTLALLVVGIIMVFSSSYSTARRDTGDIYYFLRRQIMWATVGLAALVATARVDYRFWRQWAVPGYVVATVLLGLVLVVGDETLGARRWIDLGFFTVQPSEIAKLAVVNLLAAYIAVYRSDMRTLIYGIVVPFLPVVVVFGLIMLEPDLGTGVALMGTAALMLFGVGVRLDYLILSGLAAIPPAVILVRREPYRVRRIAAFLNPWADPSDSGWSIIQSLLAIGSGGLFGLGLGESRQKFSYLPEQHTDFIFAILAEELGFLGSALVLLLFLALAWRGYRAALKAPDVYGCALATGLTTLITFQAVLNIAVVSALLPTTGITLPLISSGGSSLVATLVGIGILLNISAAGEKTVSGRA